MTYLPNHILTIICDYCGETIEQRQKRLLNSLNKTIVNMNNLQNIIIETSNSSLSYCEKDTIINDSFLDLGDCFVGDSECWTDGTMNGPIHFLMNGFPPFYNDDSFNYRWVDEN